MKRKRRHLTAEFKARVATEALKEEKTIQQIAQDNDIAPTQVSSWKKELEERMCDPYLLRNGVIKEVDEVWCADITYIPMEKGHAYLVVIMDWHSRSVLSWEVNNTMDSSFCVGALKSAMALTGRKPKIFNTDQGS